MNHRGGLLYLVRNLVCSMVLLSTSQNIFAQACEDIFPDAVQNSRNDGKIIIKYHSQIFNSPDNILDTRNLEDDSEWNSCDSAVCTSSNAIVPSSNYNSYPNNQPSINAGFNADIVVSPGDYDEMILGYQATVRMNPGVYVFREKVDIDSSAELIVNAPGAVTIFTRKTFDLGYQSKVNAAGTDRYFFIFAREDVFFDSQSEVNALVFSRKKVTLQSQADVVGAITAREDILLDSPTTVTFDNSALNHVDFSTFCTPPEPVDPPAPIAEWRLDELSWSGGPDEVNDESGNGLHGRAINNNGLPTTDLSDPALSGNPGTCGYGEFNGQADGYVQIDDPGLGSILDLDTEFTVATWVYPYSWATSGLATIVSKDENFEFHLNDSGRINWWWGGGSRSLLSTVSVPLNSWHHIAITFKSGEQHIYLDGVSVGNNDSTNSITLNNDPVLIATDYNFHSRRFNGRIDEVKIYDESLSQAQINTVMNQTHDCIVGSGLDHFNISIGSATASVCSPKSITITAADVADAPLASYAGTIALSTSTANGDWANTGVASDALNAVVPGPSDSGSASYTFDAGGGDGGVITLALSNEHAETLTVTVSDASASISNTSAPITFAENAFEVSENDSFDEDVIAGRDHQFSVQMLKRDPVTGTCGPAQNYNTATTKVWLQRSAADPGGAAPVLHNAGSSSNVSLPNAEPATDNITLPFVNGVANFRLATTDVGEYQFEFLDDSLSFSDLPISGGSTVFTTRPFAFRLTVASNPRATTAAGARFISAWDPFVVDVQALAWGANSEDANSNAIADVFEDTDPSNNLGLTGAVLPSFGQESPPESLALSHDLALPLSGNSGALFPASPVFNSFSAGQDQLADVRFSEVGIVVLNAEVADGVYMASSAARTNKSKSYSHYVGRFNPASFASNAAVSPNVITEACNSEGFSYLSQPFAIDYSLRALNGNGVVTENYQGDFQKLDTLQGSITTTAKDGAMPTLLSARTTMSNTVVSWADGIGSFSSDITVSRSAGLHNEGPYSNAELGVQVEDSDTVTLRSAELDFDADNSGTPDSMSLGLTELLFGRLRLKDASGPEAASLPVEFYTQYWNGTDFFVNDRDDCSTIAFSDISYPNGTIDNIANKTVSVGGGTSTGVYTDESGLAVNFISGNAGHYFSAPGAGNTGAFSVSIDLSDYPWLRFDWDGNGDYDELILPTATYTFGSYRGHDRIIFWQEVFAQ